MCARLSFYTRCYPPRGSRDAAPACARYVTIGVTGCSDRQKRKEQRQAGGDSQGPFGLRVRLLLCHLEDDIESDRDPERKACNTDYQPNRCLLDAKDISKQIRGGVREMG
jgi:hypothetical protein